MKPLEKAKLEKFLEMGGGTVAHFSNARFRELIIESANIDVYDEYSSYNEHPSKAKKLRHLWTIEEDAVIGRVLTALCDEVEAHYITNKDNVYYYAKYDISLLDEAKSIIARLIGSDVGIVLPMTQDETLTTLTEHIKSQLENNTPELALDRLHTFATKMIREIAVKNGIQCVNPNGDHLPLHSVAGMLNKHYQANMQISEFSKNAIKMNLSLFSSYNDIRNKQSYAHDNVIMDKNEAEFVVRTVSAILTFIDKIEHQLNAPQPKDMTLLEIEQRLAKI